jgi:hypothetical protein
VEVGLIEAAGVAVAVGAATGGEDDWAQDESNNMQKDAIVQMTLARCLNIRYPFNSPFKIIYKQATRKELPLRPPERS